MSHHKKTIVQERWCWWVFFCNPKWTVGKQSSCRWFQTLWRSCVDGPWFSYVRPGARCTNDFLVAIQIWWKLRLVVIPCLAIRPQQISAHAMIAQLSCHVQKFVATTVLSYRFWIAIVKPLVKRGPRPQQCGLVVNGDRWVTTLLMPQHGLGVNTTNSRTVPVFRRLVLAIFYTRSRICSLVPGPKCQRNGPEGYRLMYHMNPLWTNNTMHNRIVCIFHDIYYTYTPLGHIQQPNLQNRCKR